jgi:hypothetical protein
MSDNKKKAGAIIASMSPETVPMEDGAEIDASIGLESAAEELISALDSKDPKAVVAAFRALLDMADEAEGESEEEEESEPA